MTNSEAIIRVIFGKRGSGKTVLARNLTRPHNRVLYYDTLCKDYTDGAIVYDLDALRRFWLKVYQGAFRIVYRPTDPVGDFQAVCELVYECGDMWFVVEECDMFFRGDTTDPAFRNLIQRGRKEKIEMVCVTQRPKGFGRLLTSQVDQFKVFRCKEPVDLDYFRGRLGPDVSDKLEGLEQYQYLDYDERNQTTEIRTEPWP